MIIKYRNGINKTNFLSESITWRYNKLVSKEWDANHFNYSHIHDVDLFLYFEQGELKVGLENNNILNPTILAHGDSIEVLSDQMHC